MMLRRHVLNMLTLSGIVALPGCTIERTVGHLDGKEVFNVPEDVVFVQASDDRIANVTPVQQVIKEAAELDGELTTVEIEGRLADRSINSLKQLPYYDTTSSEYTSGCYIEYQDQNIVVNWAIQQ